MKRYTILFMMAFVFSISCKTTDKPEEIYNKVSNEFLDTLLKIKDFNCSCIIEPTQTIIDYENMLRPSENMKSHIMIWANLKSHSVTDSLNLLSRKTNLNKTITNSGYRLISKKQSDSIAMIKNRKDRFLVMNSICSKGFMTMTKPFFNKTLDTAFIAFDEVPNCFPSLISSYYYLNNEWIIPIEF